MKFANLNSPLIYLIMIDEFLEVGVDHLAGIRSPDELVGGVENEGQLVDLSLVEGVRHGINVGSVDPHMASAAAQPLSPVL